MKKKVTVTIRDVNGEAHQTTDFYEKEALGDLYKIAELIGDPNHSRLQMNSTYFNPRNVVYIKIDEWSD
jgi:hypothetical protein